MRINLKFLSWLVIGLAGFAVLLAGLHRLQMGRLNVAILKKAREAAREKDFANASRNYSRYLEAAQDSVDARVEYGLVLDELGDSEQAFRQLERALRLDPSRLEACQRLVYVSIDIGRYLDAKRHLEEVLIPAENDNAEWRWLLGCCERKLAQFNEAKVQLAAAVELEPDNPKYAEDFADLITDRFSDPIAARDVLDQLVGNAADNSAAFLARGRWMLGQSDKLVAEDSSARAPMLQDAWRDSMRAIQLEPESSKAIILAAQVALSNGRVDKVRPYLQKALDIDPESPEVYGIAAEIELRDGRLGSAIDLLKRGLQAIPENPDLLWNLAQLQFDAGEIDRAKDLIAELKRLNYPVAPVRFLEARLLVADGKWRQAAQLIEDSRAFFDRNEGLVKHADYLLATCYGRLGKADRQLEALRRAVNIDPLWASARQALAGVLLRSGRFREALSEYWQIARSPDPPITAITSLARLIFIDTIRQESERADWSQFQQVFAIVEKFPDAADDAAILKAEFLVARGLPKEAEQVLHEQIEQSPKTLLLRQALIGLHLQNREWDQALAALDAASETLPDSAILRLARARYLLRRYGQSVEMDTLVKLAEPNEDWTEEQSVTLAAGFAQFFMSLEQYELCEQYARVVADSAPGQTNLAIHLLLFDLAFRSRDTRAMNRSLKRVKEIEGTGPLWRVGEAVRLSVEAEKQLANRESLYGQAMDQLSQAATERSAWSRIPRLQGEIFDRQDLPDLAVEKYLEAIRLGEQDPRLVSRSVFLLFEQGRFVEADEVFRKLREQKTPFSSELMRVASEVSLQLENFDRALSLAKDWAEQSQSQEDRIWLAQMYSVTGRNDEAEAQFHEAITIDPSLPAAWVSLVQLHGRLGDIDAAKSVITKAEAAIGEKDRDFAIAQCHESIKDASQAAKYYGRALALRPNDAGVLRRFADFHLKIEQQTRAQPLLERLASQEFDQESVDQAWARRNLALVLGLRGDDRLFDRARSLITANQDRLGKTTEDQRALGIILGSRPDREAAQEAISILKDVVKAQAKYSLEDNYLLARLYLRTGDWTNYSRTMRSVLGNGGASEVRFVRDYTESLLSRGELAEGQLWFEQLNRLAPKQLRTDSVEAQLLFHSGDFQRLFALLEQRAELDDHTLWAAEMSEAFGVRLAGEGKKEASKQFFTLGLSLFQQISRESPDKQLVLASYHARRGNISLSLELLKDSDPPPTQLAQLGQGALQSGKASKEQIRELIELIRSTQKQHPGHIQLEMCLGDLCSWIGDCKMSSEAYRRILAQHPDYVPALNNLAMVFALTGQQLDQADDAINQAIASQGPTDYLLDTRGVVRLAAGNVKPAEADFRTALSSAARADRYFHLAMALLAQRRVDDARQAFEQARAGGISAEAIHPLERPSLERLEELL